MTTPALDPHAERAAQALALRLRGVSSLADPVEWARRYWADAVAIGWRYVEPTPGLKPAAPNPAAYERGAAAAREALTQKNAETRSSAQVKPQVTKPGTSDLARPQKRTETPDA